jgi:membrane-bound serine protease (ClpP class)
MRRFPTRLIGAAIVLIAGVAANVLAAGEIFYAQLEASINPVTKDYVLRVLKLAEEEDAEMVILRLDTPGGLVSSTKDIVDALLNSRVPVVVYVGPAGAWAASAGTFITLAAHVAAMARGATIGAAHPVGIGGESGEAENPAVQKTVNFLAQWARQIAEKRGRDPDWAEQAVRSSQTLGWQEALERRIINLAVDDFNELLNKLDGYTLSDERVLRTAGVSIKEIPMSWREQLLNYLADPNVVYILLIIGLYALVFEFLSPGIGIGLIAGGISLLLAFLGLQLLPVSLVGVALILFGVLLMVLDAFYTQTNGILTTGGVVSLLIGSFTLFDFQGIERSAFELAWWNIVITVGIVTAFFTFIIAKGLLAQRAQPAVGIEAMIGAHGRAKDPLGPGREGVVLVQGEYWRAIADEPIHSGEEVEVLGVQEGRLIVRRTPPLSLQKRPV